MIEVQRQLAVQEIMMNRRGQVDRQTRGYMCGVEIDLGQGFAL